PTGKAKPSSRNAEGCQGQGEPECDDGSGDLRVPPAAAAAIKTKRRQRRRRRQRPPLSSALILQLQLSQQLR
ncbi:hypothetical protein M5D96_013670, partial [Drosophila gunungcola]